MPAPSGFAGATFPAQKSPAARTLPAASFRGPLVGASAMPPAGSESAPPPAFPKGSRGTCAPLSIRWRIPDTVPDAALPRTGHRPPVRCTHRTKCFAAPNHISFSYPFAETKTKTESKVHAHRISASALRSFCVARNNVFFAVSSVVFSISPTVRNFSP